MDDLERMLVESQDCRGRLIVTDGVFSMDGNVCPLPDIKRLADKYKALIFIDECHATGFFGATGRGTEEFFNMEGSVVRSEGSRLTLLGLSVLLTILGFIGVI